MKSQGMGKRSRNQSRYQPSDKPRRNKVDKLLSIATESGILDGNQRAEMRKAFRKLYNKAVKEEPKEEVLVHPEKSSFKDITTQYRSRIKGMSLKEQWNTGHPDRKFEDLLKDEKYSPLIKGYANTNMKKLLEFRDSEKGQELINYIKKSRPGLKLSVDSELFKEWELTHNAYIRAVEDHGITSDSARDLLIEESRLAIKFANREFSTVDSIEELAKYIDSTNNIFDDIYNKKEAIKKHYNSPEEFRSAMFNLLRNARAKDKIKYDSGTALSILTGDDNFYDEFENEEELEAKLINIIDKMKPEDKVETQLNVKFTGETGGKPSTLVESYKPEDDIPQEFSKARKNEVWFNDEIKDTLELHKKLEEKSDKKSEIKEQIRKIVEDKLDEFRSIVGFKANWDELEEISKILPVRKDAEYVSKVAKKALKVESPEFGEGQLRLLSSSLNMDVFKSTYEYLNSHGNFNIKYKDDLIDLARQLPVPDEVVFRVLKFTGGGDGNI